MARNDYTKEQRDQWQAARYAGENARGVHSAKINQLPRYDSKTTNVFRPDSPLSNAINDPIAKTVKTKTIALEKEMVAQAPKGSRVTATADSSCLSEFSWKDDVATATFWRPAKSGQDTWEYDCDLDTFLEIAESGSIGAAANDLLFD